MHNILVRALRALLVSAAALASLAGAPAQATAGDPVTAFNDKIGVGLNGTVNATVTQPNGKIIVGGSFTSPALNLARFNADGTPDATFNAAVGTSLNGAVQSVALQSDGKIVLGGAFTVNGSSLTSRYLARLNADGSADNDGFNTAVGTTLTGMVRSVTVQADDKTVVGGHFAVNTPRLTSRYLARFNTDGTADNDGFNTSVATSVNDLVHAVAVQSDGSIVVGGAFTVNGSALTSKGLARFTSAGAPDTAFNDNVASKISGFVTSISALAVQSDGKILIGGLFMVGTGSNVTSGNLARFTSSGLPDNAGFNTAVANQVNGDVSSLAIQSDGQIVIGGGFTVNGASLTSRYLARVSSAGDVDNSGFNTSVGTTLNQRVNAVSLLSSGEITAGGQFTQPSNGLVRFDSAGAADATFNTTIGQHLNGEVRSVVAQPDGKFVVAGAFTYPSRYLARFNADGTPDASFNAAVGTALGGSVNALALQTDGKIVIVGQFSVNGTTLTSRYLARFNSDGTPDNSGFNTAVGTALNNSGYTVALRPNGQVVVGGAFTTPSRFLTRFNTDGSADTAFNPNVGTQVNNSVYAVAIQADDKIVIGGAFTSPASYVGRFNTDGTADTSFNSNAGTTVNSSVKSVAQQADGKLVVGGLFSAPASKLARLNGNGTADTTFNTNVGTALNGEVKTVAVESGGSLLLGGSFTVNSPHVTSQYLARVTSTGIAQNVGFNATLGTQLNAAVLDIATTADDNILVGGAFGTPASMLALIDGSKSSQTITFGAPSDVSLGAGSRSVSATATSGLSVEFSTVSPSVCTLSGTTVNLVSVGTCKVRASQPGNDVYAPAPDVERSFAVTSNPAQAASANRTGSTVTWPAIEGAVQYYVMYRPLGSGKNWGLYATANNLAVAEVRLDNPGQKKACSAANISLGYSNCATPLGYSAGRTYEFSVYSRDASGKTSLLPLRQLFTYTVPTP